VHIAIDLDDVVLDFCGGLRTAINKEFDIDLDETAFYQFDLHPILDPIVGGSWWGWLRRRDWLWENFPAVNGAIGSLEGLRAEGHYLECVTSKPRWAEYAVWRWLGKWRPPFQRVTVVSTESGSPEKWQVSEATLLVDDKPENVSAWEQGGGRPGILFGRSHNMKEQYVREQSSLLVARNWKEVREVVATVGRISA
jgi:5'(3')-deoxyribonucleotidase